MTLDAEVRALERVARARPDDGAAQVGLAAALVRTGRPREALEAFIRAASAEPGDPEVVRALRETSWWTGPRGPGGGTRHVAVPGLRRKPELVAARRLGQAGAGLAVGGGIVFARVAEEGGDTRLVALALASGRELWSREETVAAAAPPVYSDGTVLDAALVDASGAMVFRIRARDAATGADRWVRTSELTDAQPGATFLGACVSGRYAAFAIKPHGKKAFEPLVRVLDAGRGDDVEKLALRGLEDVSLESDHLAFAMGQDVRRVELRHLPQGVRVWTSAIDDPPKRVVVSGSSVVVASERGVTVYDRGRQKVSWRQERRGLYNDEAIVVTPRMVIASWQRAATSALDLATGGFLWADEPMARLLSASEDTLYAVSRDGLVIRGIDLATGEALWQADLPRLSRELDGQGVHKVGVAPSRLVGLTKEGVLFLLA